MAKSSIATGNLMAGILLSVWKALVAASVVVLLDYFFRGYVGQFAMGLAAILVFGFPMYGAYAYVEGICPHCDSKIEGIPNDGGMTCTACQNRLVIRNDKFWTIDK